MTEPTIDDIIAAAAEKARVTPEQARAVVAASLGLLVKHAAPEALAPALAAMPGAEAIARSSEARPPRGGLFGGILKATGGLSGAVVADAMGMMDRMKKLGLERVDVKRILRSVRHQVQTSSGEDLVGAALKTVPGVGGMLGEG